MSLTHEIFYSEDFNLEPFRRKLNTNILQQFGQIIYIILKPDVLFIHILSNRIMTKTEVIFLEENQYEI